MPPCWHCCALVPGPVLVLLQCGDALPQVLHHTLPQSHFVAAAVAAVPVHLAWLIALLQSLFVAAAVATVPVHLAWHLAPLQSPVVSWCLLVCFRFTAAALGPMELFLFRGI